MLGVALAACGKKGALELPAEEAPAGVAPPAGSLEEEDEERRREEG